MDFPQLMPSGAAMTQQGWVQPFKAGGGSILPATATWASRPPLPETTRARQEQQQKQQSAAPIPQARIGQDIAALSAKVSSFDDRLTKLESLATSSKDIAQRLHDLEQTAITLKSTIEKVDMKNDDLENRSRRNNLVIHGLLEPPQETPDTLLASVTGLLSDKLGVHCDVIERCHRLGARRHDKGRPVIIKLLDHRLKLEILKNSRKLKHTNIFINEDFSARVRLLRRNLWQHSTDLRNGAK
ncbi:hypothetical protein HPB50_020431 [Hyalomma asiaticum]|uniref:Uncharacterized protein n=1 Tax=Hyalomma asiaticum TaxID=266040 RepID=A0ACB7T0P8_HYAAI|nr:hypothetical protein HPB50_020431 [Hyalomma asiaticum]